MLNSVDPFELMLILSKVTIDGVPFIKYVEGDINYKENVIYLNDLVPKYTYIKIGSPFFQSYSPTHFVFLKRSAKGGNAINIAFETFLSHETNLIKIEKVFTKIAEYIERRQHDLR